MIHCTKLARYWGEGGVRKRGQQSSFVGGCAVKFLAILFTLKFKVITTFLSFELVKIVGKLCEICDCFASKRSLYLRLFLCIF